MAGKRLLGISSVLKYIQRADHHVANFNTIYPRLGNRDIVGHGLNGYPGYGDIAEIPAPAVRFKENTPEVLALREKERGSWHDLTLQEKKELYRNSFCQTYAEMDAPTGDWKYILTIVLGAITATFWVNYFIKTHICAPLPHTITREWQIASLEKMVRERQQPISGMGSKWDYENNRWK